MTATQDAIAKQIRKVRDSRLRRAHERFRERWAPKDRRDEFEVDLAILMREVAIDALQPIYAARPLLTTSQIRGNV